MKKMKESTIVVCEILGASFNTSFITKLTAVFKDHANFRKCSKLLWLSTAFAAFITFLKLNSDFSQNRLYF